MRRFLLLALAALTCIAARPGPMTPGRDGIWDGYITQGRRFGVRIGETREQALAALKARGYKAWEQPQPCDSYFMQFADCTGMESLIRVRVVRLGWDGVINLGFRDDRVVAVIWRGTLQPYIDF